MESIKNIEMNMKNLKIDKVTFQKMVFIYNAIENGWTIKKNNDSFYFTKKLENKKEVFLDKYLSDFIDKNFNTENLLSTS